MDKVLLIDFENVQKIDLEYLERKDCKVFIFIGSSQNKLPFDLVRSAQRLGTKVEWIKIDGTGSNALDFHIAYYLGTQVSKNPSNEYLILSKDKGFDPLIKHLNAQKIVCHRWTSIADIPLAKAPKTKAGREAVEVVKVSKAKAGRERVDVVIENLEKRKASKPRTLKTLRSTINARFGSQLTEEELDKIIDQLASRRVLKIADGKVTYEMT